MFKDHCSVVMPANNHRQIALGTILENAAEHAGIPSSAMVQLLDSPTPGLLEKLFTAARKQREKHFGRRVFLYGFLYISTHCRNQCSFCFYRKNNDKAVRYRKTEAQILESAEKLADDGVHLIDLTAGEDPQFYDGDFGSFVPIVKTVEIIKKQIGLPVMASVGVVPDKVIDQLSAAGADWFACYQETHNPLLFKRLRKGQSYHTRYQSKIKAKEKGMLVEEGLLCGVGETSNDIANSFDAMARLKADQVRVMTFIPQAGTPMKDHPQLSFIRERIIIALMRITFPHLLIPASLDVDGLDGLQQRLDAGANVITSLVPPHQKLAGVAQSSLDIEDGRRTVKEIAQTLRNCNLQPATVEQYGEWLNDRKKKITNF